MKKHISYYIIIVKSFYIPVLLMCLNLYPSAVVSVKSTPNFVFVVIYTTDYNTIAVYLELYKYIIHLNTWFHRIFQPSDNFRNMLSQYFA